ncbi:uncharacterized protein [Salminus brasiliensis]|uniref:uncharacterized protein isoform X2 n=1 Tax=Salminus brasiliensis TaxID=930266 RepID=UPI003B8369FA
MTDIQPRDVSPGHSSDNEPRSNLTKSKDSPPASSDKHQESDTKELSDLEDDEPLLTLMKKRKKKQPDKEETAVLDKKEVSDSEDDEPVLTLMKKRKNKKPDTEETAVIDSNKPKSPRKHQTEAKVSKLRQSSPSQAKATQKRGRKGKEETRRMASAQSTPESTTPKKRGRPKKEATERKAPSRDSSDNEPLVQLAKKNRQPEMKQAVVLLKRMSKRDVIDMITQGHTHTQKQSGTARAGVKSEAESSDEEPLSHKVKKLKQHSKPVRGRATADVKSEADSSDEEPLSHKVKRLKQHSKPARGRATADVCSDDESLVKRAKAVPVKNKCAKRTNGEKDPPKKEAKLGDELNTDSDNECLVKRKSDKAAQSLHRETSSS